MNRGLFLWLWLLLSASLLVASAPQTSQALADQTPQIQVAVAQATVQPGVMQRLNIQLDESPARRTSLILVVTYPSGEIARSLHYIDGERGAIAWPIPATAGVGEASFRLVVNGCACGEHNTIPQQTSVEGTVGGSFVIGRLQ